MFKIKVVTVAVVGVVLVGLAAGALARASDEPADLKAIKGTWAVTSAEIRGQESPDAEQLKKARWVFDGEEISVEMPGQEARTSSFTLDPDADPGAIDIIPLGGPENEKGKPFLGIYKVEGDDLTICMAPPGFDRPGRFATEPGTGTFLVTLKRAKP